MQEEFKLEGKCLFCGETHAKAEIDKHLSTHLQGLAKSGQAGKSFLVQVTADPIPHFLSLWIDGETAMEIIDKFLRDIWLECCGHLSEFEGNVGMKKAGNVFKKGKSLNYEYDFGSSTRLTLTTVDEYPIKADKKIVLLSRNEPINLMCATCKKAPATQICSVCMYEKFAMYCDTCAKKHAKKCADFADYASLPIVNSPRMGVCGYTGGRIDKERDGVYKLK
jgi:hypothetical protein